MKSRINRDEREISITELWWYVISKWKWLVIGMVVGALVMGAFGAYSVYKKNEDAKNNIQKEYTMDDLSLDDQEEVKALIEDYKFYQQELDRLDNNYLMKLNFNNISYCMVTYYIDTEYSYNYEEIKENYANTLISAYKTFIHSDEVHKRIMESGIDGLEEADLPHIYGVVNEGYIIKIAASADTENSRLIIDIVSEEIEKYYEQAASLIGKHKLVKISIDTRNTNSESIKYRQDFYNLMIKNMSSEIENRKNDLSLEQLTVYLKEVEGVKEETPISENFRFNSQNFIGGILGGFLLTALISVLIYVTGGKINSLNEVKQVYGVSVIGSFIRDDASNRYFLEKINKINARASENKQKEYIIKTIIQKCKVNDIKDIFICSSVNGMDRKISDIVDELVSVGIGCDYGEDINSDVNSFERITNIKNVVFVEQIGVTNKSNFEDEIELCDKCSVNILGIIVVI